ncbi:hypothetical protein MSMTP_2716 [Methanosarcina sp. MTP4]|uniref:hypothetical protein n=1 Tax=Methanosarcina sp. MTP4 TaxID=1434100 RepID=UPI000615F65D|nr:hypothetical protein [Methanosarcina sp. MTP4]AKB26185.1 hypothetical protein MSMTP_2716 [Methanosarcina sp. MTP4]
MEEQMKALKEKLADDTLKSAELFAFIDRLKASMREGTPIVRNISHINIELLETYSFALQKYEMTTEDKDSELRAADWRERIDDFSKLKEFVDELQKSELIINVAWNVGGMAIYDIPKPKAYKDFVYWNIKNVLDNIDLFDQV